jgi:hypothetical protein
MKGALRREGMLASSMRFAAFVSILCTSLLLGYANANQ